MFVVFVLVVFVAWVMVLGGCLVRMVGLVQICACAQVGVVL